MRHSTREKRQQYWRAVVSAHKRSGLPVRGFCEKEGICEHSFYVWRRRLEQGAQAEPEQPPVRFALVETKEPAPRQTAEGLELVLAGGARLRIGAGVDGVTLRTVLEALRA